MQLQQKVSQHLNKQIKVSLMTYQSHAPLGSGP